MSRTVNEHWNRRALSIGAMAENRYFRCADCRRVAAWTQTGDLPERCRPCSKLWNERAGDSRDVCAPWDLSTLPVEGDILERLDRILHWSPAIARWLYWDGDRWVKGWEGDAYRICLALVAPGRRPNSHSATGHADTTRSVVEAFRAMCVERGVG